MGFEYVFISVELSLTTRSFFFLYSKNEPFYIYTWR